MGEPVSAIGDLLDFLDFHKPALEKGNYRIRVSQTFRSSANPIAMDTSGYRLVLSAQTDATLLPLSGPENASVLMAAGIGGTLLFRVYDSVGRIVVDLPEAALNAPAGWAAGLQQDLAPYLSKAMTAEQSGGFLTRIAAQLGASFGSERTFTVGGERFALNPQDVLSVFPPPGSNGDHANCLPHVLINRSTLPWERLPFAHDKADEKAVIPWMAILLFDDVTGSDMPLFQTVKLGLHRSQGGGHQPGTLYGDDSVAFIKPGYDNVEGGEVPDQPVDVIDVPTHVAQDILPKLHELPYLAHVRRREPADMRDPGAEHAIVVGNRLPAKGIQSVAYLVSLEHRYSGRGFEYDGDKPVRFVVLKSWRFRCQDQTSYMLTDSIVAGLGDKETRRIIKTAYADKIGREIVLAENFRKALGRLTDDQYLPVEKASVYKKLSFKGLLMSLDRGPFRLPDAAPPSPEGAADDTVSGLLKQSMVVVPHALRNGGASASAYHGPFTSGGLAISGQVPVVQAADHLLRVEKQSGMLDTSYSAAWQLGRMMMLASKQVSLDLFNWKRVHTQMVKAAARRLAHLPFNRLPGNADVPGSVRRWLYDAALLKGVPYNYLVPHPGMLPDESIRFFKLDPLWVESLLDGAFSIGRINSMDVAREKDMHGRVGRPVDLAADVDWGDQLITSAVEGVLIRSEVVPGWPQLQVDGHAILRDDLAPLVDGLNTALTDEMPESTHARLSGLGLVLPARARCKVRRTGRSGKDDTNDGWQVYEMRGKHEANVCRIDSEDHTGAHWRLVVTLPLLRKETLGSNVLLCLFQGHIDAVSVHLKPEAIHFGVDAPDTVHDHNYKELRHYKEAGFDDGEQNAGKIIEHIPWRSPPNKARTSGIINISALANGNSDCPGVGPKLGLTGDLPAGAFALQMVEGVDRVMFERGEETG